MSFKQLRNFDKIKSMTFDELAIFLESITNEDSPWMKWFGSTLCENCAPIIEDNSEFNYCELNNHCKFFKNFATDEDIIKMWLNAPQQ